MDPSGLGAQENAIATFGGDASGHAVSAAQQLGLTCTLGGIDTPCTIVLGLMQLGVAAQCPNNECIGIRYQDAGGGVGVLQQWQVAMRPGMYTADSFDANADGWTASTSWQTVGVLKGTPLLVPAGNDSADVPVGLDIWHNSRRCPNCANMWRDASGAANAAFIATGVVLIGVPAIGEAGGAVAACNPGLNTGNYGHVTVYCRAWNAGNLIGIGYDPQNGLHVNVGNSVHIPLWPWP